MNANSGVPAVVVASSGLKVCLSGGGVLGAGGGVGLNFAEYL